MTERISLVLLNAPETLVLHFTDSNNLRNGSMTEQWHRVSVSNCLKFRNQDVNLVDSAFPQGLSATKRINLQASLFLDMRIIGFLSNELHVSYREVHDTCQ